MGMALHLPSLLPCPVCGAKPEVDECGPWPAGMGPAPWYVGCYRSGSDEHFVGVNADTKRQAMLDWNNEVERALKPQSSEGAL